MRAAAWSDVGALELVELPRPSVQPGSVLVRVDAVGICGSDLHCYRGTLPPMAGLVPGHEIGGELIDAGGSGLAAGMPVAVEPLLTCGSCPECRSGNDNRCRQRTLLGVTGGTGGFTEFLVVPEQRIYPLGIGMSAADGALVEPLAVCVRAVKRAGIALGETVAVLGLGTIGLLSVVAARAAGAGLVLGIGGHPHQRERATAFGADAVFTTAAEAAEAAGEGADVVIEAVGGRAGTLTEAVELVRPGGVIAMLGDFAGDAQLPGLAFSRKEARLVTSNCYARSGAQRDFDIAIALLRRHLREVRSIVTHRFPLERVDAAFAVAADRAARSIKLLVLP
jgi:threonine dehydrogenase-like Zn-dependent dehydrogenase